MRVTCLTTFLDGPRRYEAGDTVTVPDSDAARFVSHGWATYEGAAPAAEAAAATTLNIHSASGAVRDTQGA